VFLSDATKGIGIGVVIVVPVPISQPNHHPIVVVVVIRSPRPQIARGKIAFLFKEISRVPPRNSLPLI